MTEPQVMTDADFWRAIGIASTGLVIVFTALILISLFIASLPRLLEQVARIWPEVEESASHTSHPESQVADNAAVVAAIGYVLHTEMQKQMAAERSHANKN